MWKRQHDKRNNKHAEDASTRDQDPMECPGEWLGRSLDPAHKVTGQLV